MSVKYVASSKLPTPWGTFTMVGFEDESSGKEHVALVFGEVAGSTAVLARAHSECLTGDALFSLRCDCGFQLQEALKRISEEGSGVLLYLRQEGRGIGLLNKIRAYHLQDGGADTVEANEQLGFAADMRDYSMCLPMLEHLGVQQVRLMTNNPRKVKALEQYGVPVSERVPLQVGKNRHNEQYLATKMGKLGHMMTEHHFRDDEEEN
ncbi:GTP cyclohydrolase II [Marinobacterium sp. OS208]|nr:GTP cyclohydrolase II [Marinobacterium sedimentorum]